MRRFFLACLLAASGACASAGMSPMDQEPGVERLPLLQVTNQNYNDAAVFMNGRKLGELNGLTGNKLFVLRKFDIPPHGQVQIQVRFERTREILTLPVIVYEEGRKMRVNIAPLASTSTAWE